MPGLLDQQLSSKLAKFTAQKAHGLVAFFGGGPSAAPNNIVTITDGVTPEVYTLPDDNEANSVTALAGAINTGSGVGGPSALVDAYDIGGNVVLIAAKTAGVPSPAISINLNSAMVADARDHVEAADDNDNALVDGHADEVEVLVANEHTMTQGEIDALADAVGAQAAISTVTLGEAPKLISVLRRNSTGSYQSLVNVEVDLVNLAGDEYAVLLTDAGAVLGVDDSITFLFLTG